MLGLLNIPNIDLTLDLTFLQISDFIHHTSDICHLPLHPYVRDDVRDNVRSDGRDGVRDK